MAIILDHDYHVVELNSAPPPEMLEWLSERMGDEFDRWFYRQFKIYFKNANDHLLFVIRWASA